MSRVPLKGQPDFTLISKEKLTKYIDTVQQMIFSYTNCDDEVTKTLKKVWKDLVDEETNRVVAEAYKQLDKDEKEEKEGPSSSMIKIVERKKLKLDKRVK